MKTDAKTKTADKPKNKGGRPKGSKDKVKRVRRKTAEELEFGIMSGKQRGTSQSKNVQRLKDRLAEFLGSEEEIQMMIDDLHAIDNPKDRTAARKDLYQYIIPKVTATDINATMEVESISDDLSRLTHTTVDKSAAIGIPAIQTAIEQEIQSEETETAIPS